MKYPRKWENINNDEDAGCARLKIFGGWLVVSWCNEKKEALHPAEPLLFISDVHHEWELEGKK